MVYSGQHLLFLIVVIPWVGMKCCFVLVVICVLLVASDTEYLSIGYLDIFWGVVSVQILSLCLNWITCLCITEL